MKPAHFVWLGLVLVIAGGLWWLFGGASPHTIEPLSPGAGAFVPSDVAEPGDSPLREVGEGSAGVGLPETDVQNLTLYVRVVDEKGQVVERANVGITGPAGESRFSLRDAQQAHAFDELPPGEWTIRAYAQGYAEVAETVELRAQDLVTERRVTMPRATLCPVRFVTPDGRDAREALAVDVTPPLAPQELFVIATEKEPEAFLPRMAPGARLQYGVGIFHPSTTLRPDGPIPHPGDDFAGVLELKRPPPLHASCVLREKVLDTQRIAAGGNPALTFTIRPEAIRDELASLTVQVLDAETRGAIEKLSVNCEEAHIAGSGEEQVDDEGRITFANRMPGWAALRVWAPGYEVYQRTVRFIPGEARDLGTIYLFREVAVRGRVVNQDGEGVRSVFFLTDEQWDGEGAPPELGHTLGGSQADGTLVLKRAGRRRYDVHVKAHGYAPQVFELDLREGQAAELEVELVKGTRTVLSTRYPESRTNLVSILDGDGRLVFTEHIPGGRTRDAWLAPGNYELVVHHGSRQVARRPLRVSGMSALHEVSE